MAFEQDVLEEVTAARAAYVRRTRSYRRSSVNKATTSSVRSLLAVVEE